MKHILLIILMAWALVACGDDSANKQSDEDYCNTTYVSTWDGRQVKPLNCPEE